MGKKHSTRFITAESDVPEGYVPLASFDHTTRLHRALSKAHAEGRVRAVKLVRHEGDIKTGAVWVHEGDAAVIRAAYDGTGAAASKADQQAATPSQIEAAVVAMCEISNTLVLVYGLLERLTQAVEKLQATPAEAGSWRDMNGESL